MVQETLYKVFVCFKLSFFGGYKFGLDCHVTKGALAILLTVPRRTSFVDLLRVFSVLCLLCLCVRLFICALWSPAGKGLTSWLSFVVSTVSLSLSHWYPGSGVVLDCIDS